MNEDLTLVVAIYEGRSIPPRAGWNVVVTAQLDGHYQSSDPVPLTSQPKFNVEVSWALSTAKLRKFKQNLVPLKLECVAVDSTSDTRQTLGYVILQLNTAVKGLTTDAKWHRLLGGVSGPHKFPPALQLSLNVISSLTTRDGGGDVEECMEVDSQPSQDLQVLRAVERPANTQRAGQVTVISANKSINNSRGRLEKDEEGNDSVIVDGMYTARNVRQRNRRQIQRDPGGGRGRLRDVSEEEEEEEIVEVVGGRPGSIGGHNLRSRATRAPSLLPLSPQAPTRATIRTTFPRYGHTSVNHNTEVDLTVQPSDSSPQRSYIRRSPRNALPITPIKENGHSGSHKSNISDLPVALPTSSTTRAGPSKTQTGSDSPRLVPRLSNSGGFFQIGPAGEPNEQTFNFSVTIIYAKHLDQVVPNEVQITEGKQARFCYSLLSHVVYTDPIMDLSNPDFLAEVAGGKVMATANNVSKYFTQHPQLPIHLLLGDVCLATASVDLAQFGKDVLRGEGPMKVEGQYPLVAITRDPLAQPPVQQAILGVAVTLSVTPREEPECYQPLALRESVQTSSSVIMVDLPSSSSNSADSDSEEDLMDRAGSRHGHGSVALTSRKLAEAANSWKHDRKSLMYEAAMEMETWKEGQQQVFWQQWSAREAELQRHLAKEWETRVSETELHLHRRLDQCQALHRRLTDELVNLDQMERNVAIKEEKLKAEEEDLAQMKAEVKEMKKQLKRSNQRERESIKIGMLKQQLLQERQKKRELKQENRQLEAANVAARRTAQVTHLGTRVKDEEIEALKTQVDQLHEQLGEAQERKQHYKERWIKATSQLHQLLSDPRFRHHHQDIRMDMGGGRSSSPPLVYVQSHPTTVATRSLKYKGENSAERDDTGRPTTTAAATRRSSVQQVRIESEDDDNVEPPLTRWRKDDRPGKSSDTTIRQQHHHTTPIPTARRSLLRQKQSDVEVKSEPEDAETEPMTTRWRKDNKPGKSSDMGPDGMLDMFKARNELSRLVRNRGNLDDEVGSLFPPAIQEAQKKIRSLDALDDR